MYIKKIEIEIKPSTLTQINNEFTREASLISKRINDGESDNKTTVAIRVGEFYFTWKPEIDSLGKVINF